MFLDEGFGIEARFKQGRWEEHLNKSKLFISDSLMRIGKVQSILVLGAGRLYDCDLHVLSMFCDEIILIDADPRSVASWPKKVGEARVSALCKDVTGVFHSWGQTLRNGGGEFLDPTEPAFPKADIIISLNLKSQLSVLFREYVGKSILELETRLQRNHYLDVFKQSEKACLFLHDLSYSYLRDGLAIERESLDIAPIEMDAEFSEILTREWVWNLEEGKIVHDVIGRAFARAAVKSTESQKR